MTEKIHIQRESAVAWLVLNQPEIHNAFDDALIAELTAALIRLDKDTAVRIVILAAAGKSFSAGADLNWMRRMADYSREENLADSKKLALLMHTLNSFSKPTIGLVQGAAFGGGVGLVACCDLAIASSAASFCLSEVKLGLIPAVISPYVVQAIGARAARRYFLTAERFDAEEALRIGLVHQVVEPNELSNTADTYIAALLAGGPDAQRAAKQLLNRVVDKPIDQALQKMTAEFIADIRASREGKEGVAAFLEKRAPNWIEE